MLSQRVGILSLVLAGAFLYPANAATPATTQAAASQTAASQPASTQAVTPQDEMLPLTTTSAEARQAFEQGLVRFQRDLRIETAVNIWEQATKKDPGFALAHGLIAFVSRDPAVQAAHRKQALAFSKNVSKGEQLVIAWMADAGNSHFLDAIADMNQVLALYPHDQNLVWFAGWWLIHENENEKAISFFERTTNFPGSWNELAYCYAARHDWDKMLAAAHKYLELLPHEPNPHDSLAELSRVMGRFDDALAEYRTALQTDPTFSASQVGIADTYTLIGDQARARAEYDKAIKMAPTGEQATEWAMDSANTYAREKNFEAADKAFRTVAEQAHAKGLGELEAEAYRRMALCQKDPKAALALLSKASGLLKQDKGMSNAARQQALALVQYASVLRRLEAGQMEKARAEVAELNRLADSSRGPAIMRAYYSASGAMLAAQGNWEDAVQDLEEDARDPFAMRTLVLAYQKLGKADEAKQAAEALANLNRPTLEQALVVPDFRRQKAAVTALQ
jgi:tetratricopeptide (TPR) repeat protein